MLKEWPKSYSNDRKYVEEEVYFKSNESSYLPLLSRLPSLNNGIFYSIHTTICMHCNIFNTCLIYIYIHFQLLNLFPGKSIKMNNNVKKKKMMMILRLFLLYISNLLNNIYYLVLYRNERFGRFTKINRRTPFGLQSLVLSFTFYVVQTSQFEEKEVPFTLSHE